MKVTTSIIVDVELLAKERDLLDKCGCLKSIDGNSYNDFDNALELVDNKITDISSEGKEAPKHLYDCIELLEDLRYEFSEMCEYSTFSEINLNYKNKTKRVKKVKKAKKK